MDEKKTYDNVLIDVYNLCYRYGWRLNKRTPKDIACAFFKAYETYKKKFGQQNTHYYFLFDNATTLWMRKKLNPNYKANRDAPNKPFFRAFDIIETIAHFYDNDVTIYRYKGLEADDYVPNIISRLPEGSSSIMISTDKDWSRCISNSNKVVEQYLDSTRGIIDFETYEKMFGYKPTYSNVCFDKAIFGDDSDCIEPVIPELPKAMFKTIISNFRNMRDFLGNVDKVALDPGWRIRFKKEANQLMINWEIVSAPHLSNDEMNQYSYTCKYDEGHLKALYSTFNITFDDRINYDLKTSIYDVFDGEPVPKYSEQKETTTHSFYSKDGSRTSSPTKQQVTTSLKNSIFDMI